MSSFYEPIQAYDEIIKRLKFDEANAKAFKEIFDEYLSSSDINSIPISNSLLIHTAFYNIGTQLLNEKQTERAIQFLRQAVIFGKRAESILVEPEKIRLKFLSIEYPIENVSDENIKNLKEGLKKLISKADSFQLENKIEKALELFQEGIKIIEDTTNVNYQKINEEVSLLYICTVKLLEQKGNNKQAEEVAKKGLGLVENLYGLESSEVVILIESLSNICKKQGNMSEALFYVKKQLDILRKTKGEDHPETNKTKFLIGAYYLETQEFRQAQEVFEEYEKYLSENPELPDASGQLELCYLFLTECYGRFEQWEKAMDYFNRGLELKAQSSEINILNVQFYLKGARIFIDNDKYLEDATYLLEKSIEIYERLEDSQYTAKMIEAVTDYAEFFLVSGQYQDAIRIHEKALKWCQRIKPTSFMYFESIYNYLGNLYLHEGKYEKSFWNYLDGFDCCEKLPGTSEKIAFYHERLKLAYSSLGGAVKLRVSREIGSKNGGAKIKKFLKI